MCTLTIRGCDDALMDAILYAEIFGTLKRKGTPIPINDIWIAAVTLDQGAILFSRDDH